MGRRKKNHDNHIDETWLIPYADLLTLLLALFIVLFAASAVDANKFEQIASSFNIAFQGGTGIFEQPSPIPPPITPGTPANQRENDRSSDDLDDLGLGEIDYQELRRLQNQINTYIEENNLGLSLQTDLTQQGLMITILDGALFSSGSAEIRSDARKLAEEIAQLLVTDPPRHITISGHTDNVPINTSQFPSNWALSSMRALNFMEILLENPGLEPHRLSATAYGEFRPVADNDTPEGRAKNRRVEVQILPFD